MVISIVIQEDIKIFLCKDQLKLLHMSEKERDVILDLVLVENFKEILKKSDHYSDIKTEYSESS